MNVHPQQAVGAVVLVATLLFLLSQRSGPRLRRVMQTGSIAVYGALVVAVVTWVVLWLLGIVG